MDFTSWGKILVEEYRYNDMRVIVSKPNSKTDYWIYVNVNDSYKDQCNNTLKTLSYL